MDSPIQAISLLEKKYQTPSSIPRCPSSRELVLYADQPEELTGEARKRIHTHLTVCLTCREKIGWCQGHHEEDILP